MSTAPTNPPSGGEPNPAGTPPADPSTNQPPANPPAAPPAAAPPADPNSENDAAKYRRLFEKSEREKADVEKQLQKIKDSELSETERLKKEADDAKAEAAKLKVENLRERIARETGLSSDAIEFLSGQDEETLKAQAAKLGAMTKAAPVVAGTTTNPQGKQQPSVDEQIEAAQKAGNTALAITLKRQKAGIGRINTQA